MAVGIFGVWLFDTGRMQALLGYLVNPAFDPRSLLAQDTSAQDAIAAQELTARYASQQASLTEQQQQIAGLQNAYQSAMANVASEQAQMSQMQSQQQAMQQAQYDASAGNSADASIAMQSVGQ